MGTTMSYLLSIVGAGVAILAAPVVLSAAGFTTAGIAAGSIAASVMSASGTVASSGVYATLQSVGVTGLGVAGKFVVGGAGAAVGLAIASHANENYQNCRVVANRRF